MDYKLVALDIDGTILTTSEELTPRTRRAILQVQERGVQVALATGRPLARTLPWAQALGISLPLIVHNGAVLYDQKTKTNLCQAGIDLQIALEIQQELNNRNLNYIVYTGESSGEEIVAPRGTWQDGGQLLLHYVGDSADFIEEVVLQAEPIRISIVDVGEQVDLFYQHLLTNYHGLVNPLLYGAERQHWRGIEIVPPNSSKGTGLAYLAESLAIPQEQVVAMGDNVNDLEMILWAGLGVALENATTELKSVAKRVAPSNDHEGVAMILEELFL